MLILTPFLISTHFMLTDVMTKPADKGTKTIVRMRNVMMKVHSAGSVTRLSSLPMHYMEKLSCTSATLSRV